MFDLILGSTITEYAKIGNALIGIIKKKEGFPDEFNVEPEGYFVVDMANHKVTKGLSEKDCIVLLQKDYGIQTLPQMTDVFPHEH